MSANMLRSGLVSAVAKNTKPTTTLSRLASTSVSMEFILSAFSLLIYVPLVLSVSSRILHLLSLELPLYLTKSALQRKRHRDISRL